MADKADLASGGVLKPHQKVSRPYPGGYKQS